MAQQKASRVTPLEHTAIGALGGVIEVCLMQPTVAVKNALQEGRPLPKHPALYYRGLLINAASMAPITATQFGTSRLIENLLTQRTGEAPGTAGRFLAAAAAGTVSAFIGSPSEMIIIHQQRNGRPLAAEVRHFFSTYGALPIYRGITACMARETMYAGGYLGLCPILYDRLKSSPSLAGYPPSTAMIIAGITGGVFAAACSHPFDTVKTRMQAYMYSKPEYLTVRRSARTIYQEGGILQFWKGLTPRMTRIVAATFILTKVRQICVGHLEEQRADKEPALLSTVLLKEPAPYRA